MAARSGSWGWRTTSRSVRSTQCLLPTLGSDLATLHVPPDHLDDLDAEQVRGMDGIVGISETSSDGVAQGAAQNQLEASTITGHLARSALPPRSPPANGVPAEVVVALTDVEELLHAALVTCTERPGVVAPRVGVLDDGGKLRSCRALFRPRAASRCSFGSCAMTSNVVGADPDVSWASHQPSVMARTSCRPTPMAERENEGGYQGISLGYLRPSQGGRRKGPRPVQR